MRNQNFSKVQIIWIKCGLKGLSSGLSVSFIGDSFKLVYKFCLRSIAAYYTLQAPFEVRRRGWGEFPVQVKLIFANDEKEVDITHQLNLDTTFSGVQTPGAETVSELFLVIYK